MKKCMIYGAGFAGKIATHYFEICLKRNVDAIVVSDGHRELKEYKLCTALTNKVVPVYELSELSKKDDVEFYLTIDVGYNEVVKNLNHLFGEKNVFNIFPQVSKMTDEVFKRLFDEYGINLSADFIKFKDVKINNFLMEDSAFESTFFGTLGDELLPGIFNDNSFAIDGPYEWGECVNIKEDDVVLDVGANLGLFSCYAANKGCKVYACDPDRRCIQVLEQQKKLYNNIEILPIGLSDTTGTITFYESQNCSVSSISLKRGKTEETEIELNTIDNLVATRKCPHIDFIKADIEGSERYMLRGAKNTLKTMAPKLSICTYHYKEDPQLLESIIKEANPKYIVTHAWRKLYAYVPEEVV